MHAIDSLIDQKIIRKTKIIQLLSKSMHSRLPSKYHHHCWLIDITDNCALIAVDSAEVATALRYQQHELLKQINEEFSKRLNTPLRRIKIKVIAPEAEPLSSTESASAGSTNTQLARTYCRQILDFLADSSADIRSD
ncbi:MAG: DUF721 domain-containing protein [Candidatus Thioglobus sp.]|nr:MAG: DUF721 domain-containing protein [Candidatus Thioglobus sp.]